MDMPPTRYRVVEQGRRLVVIDNWTGQPAQHMMRATEPPRFDERRRTTIEQASASLRAPPPPPRPVTRQGVGTGAGLGGPDWILSTQSWFDDEGPRRIRIAPGGQGQLTILLGIAVAVAIFAIFFLGWILLPLAFFALLQSGTRKALRSGITVWLTGLGEEVG
ncbi:hypothetical protein [Sphingomonas sp. G-3-2-10]|uniref:hypothetical protein n=1 Tax=Sphingomonas sp. G-3-2-10 TaxID=2728838 RepID=UPI00146CA847|nr:hypothetical protein [Sphingomonas sp. G-3-2-10]NML08211.1 hypothetical protein [Sphingomonas sp. G-3-2-10]